MKKKKIVKVRQELDWQVIYFFLYPLSDMGIFNNDQEFQKLYTTLFDYVKNKMALPYTGDIRDMYVIVEQECEED